MYCSNFVTGMLPLPLVSLQRLKLSCSLPWPVHAMVMRSLAGILLVDLVGAVTLAQKNALVERHNTLRAAIKYPCTASNMEVMEWDETLAQAAESYAQRCEWAHDSENTAMVCPHNTPAAVAMRSKRTPSRQLRDGERIWPWRKIPSRTLLLSLCVCSV